MPLVTRTAVSGNVYRQATEPSDWLNGDLWIDTDNGQAYVNVNGTATPMQFSVTSITGQTDLTGTAPVATTDELVISDAGVLKKVDVIDVLETISNLTADASPDTAADYVMSWDNSANTVKKVLITDLLAGAASVTLSNIAVRHSVAESILTTITPAANTHHIFNVYKEGTLPATVSDITISANRLDDIELAYGMTTTRSFMGLDAGAFAPNEIFLNDESDMDITTPATVGTYIFQRIGRIWTE